MNIIYNIGLIAGICIIYVFVTIGLGFIICGREGVRDIAYAFFFAWFIGFASFIIVCISALESNGYIILDNEKPINTIREDCDTYQNIIDKGN